jgi:hypothetical protein
LNEGAQKEFSMRSVLAFCSLVLATAAQAANDSAYTDFDLKKCKALSVLTPEEEGSTSGDFECMGHANVPYYFVEGDLRSFLSFGKNGQEHCAYGQTFAGFNTSGDKIEWRLKDGEPIATILRWRVSYDPEDSTKLQSWLVVTKIDSNNSCHVGYVDGSYPNANEEARKLADRLPSENACETFRPVFLIKPGADTRNITMGECPRP